MTDAMPRQDLKLPPPIGYISRVDEAARQPDLLIPETRAAPVQESLL